MWNLHVKLLKENRTDPVENKKITKVTNLKIGQLVFFVNDHQKGTFDPTYIYHHRVSDILNDSTVVLNTPHGKQRKCNIHHIKLMTPVDASTNALNQIQNSIKKTPYDAACNQYNLRSRIKLT